MFERIVVAVDGSEPAKHALSVVCNLATQYGSELHLVHSPQVETTAIAVGAGAVEIAPDPNTIAEAGRKVMREAESIATAKGCNAKQSIVGSHDPATDILKVITMVEADLVVLGRRGLGSIGSLLMGSVSQKVSHGATCSCMTVS
ncbi:universal stress protein [Actibacterium sp. 188UL27-1]|uniref:universal stress protein n=1 Tax=Actibacterium sp. 188UL27-1 TaxID=2786961 RepID=UPI00195C1972|nr:universal stress protein [Actibacterium sp. 188UL27-1]MBM7070134.1 universal stress protein [Actibacterium sp. 188UL27-1]